MSEKRKAKIAQLIKQTLDKVDDDWVEVLCDEISDNLANINSAADIERFSQETIESLEIDSVQIKELFGKLVEAKIVSGGPAPSERKATAPISTEGPDELVAESKLKKNFKKELDNRTDRSGSGITNRMFNCEHKWDGAGAGAGQKCMICGFETTNKVWGCFQGCGIALCGSCMFKWRQKME